MQLLSSLVARLPYPTQVVQRVIAVAAIITQAGIGVTGSIVRVTGSGLGCPTWPQCFPGSMFPVEHPEYQELNQWIEFGNRLLTIIVAVVAALCVLVAWRIRLDHPQRTRLVKLAWTMPGGVAAQAVIGGITVLTGLLWWTVAIHFLASAALVWLAVLLLHAFEEGDEPPRLRVRPADRTLLAALAVMMSAILITGTAVTGAGPHGGDPETPRLHLSIELLAQVHGALLLGYLLILALLGLQWLRTGATRHLWWRYAAVWFFSLAQGGLGSLQYRLGVPESLVSLHVLGAALVIVATATLWCAARDRGPVISHVPAAESARENVPVGS